MHRMKDVVHNAERFLMVRFAHTNTHGQLARNETKKYLVYIYG